MSPFRTLVALLGFSVPLILGIGQAEAHAKLVGSDPAADATVAAPTKIELRFSQDLAPKLSKLAMTRADGSAVVLKPVETSDTKDLAAILPPSLPVGEYNVSWTAVTSGDGHKTQGTYKFTVK